MKSVIKFILMKPKEHCIFLSLSTKHTVGDLHFSSTCVINLGLNLKNVSKIPLSKIPLMLTHKRTSGKVCVLA